MTPHLFPLLGIIAGILVAGIAGFGPAVSLIPAGAGIALYVMLLRIHKPASMIRTRSLHKLWIFLVFCGIGMFTESIGRPGKVPGTLSSGPEEITARVNNRRAVSYGDRLEVTLLSQSSHGGEEAFPSGTKAILKTAPSLCRAGDIIRLRCVLSPAGQNFKGNHAYLAYLRRKGIVYTADLPELSPVAVAHKPTLADRCTLLRGRITELIQTTPLSDGSKALLSAMLLGEREYIPENMRNEFSVAGIAHILALSGTHVAIIAALFLALLFPLNLFQMRKWRLAFTAVLLWGFALLTGMAYSTVRACVMASCLFIALMMQRKNSVYNSLCAAAMIILVADPSALWDPGMQLSFAAVWGLATFATPLNPFERHNHPRLFACASFVVATLAVTAATWTITAWHFHTFSLNFLLANIVVLPLLPFFLIMGIIYVILAYTGIAPRFLAEIIDHTVGLLNRFVSFISNDGTAAVFISPGWQTIALWSLALLSFALILHIRSRNETARLAGNIPTDRIASGKWQKSLALFSLFIMIATFVTFPLFADARPEDRFTIVSRSDRPEIRIIDQGKETSLIIPQHETSVTKLDGHILLTLDSPDFDPRRIAAKINGEKNTDNPEKVIILLCRGGVSHSKLKILSSLCNPHTIVVHPSVYPAAEQNIYRHLVPAVHIHSLRHEGDLTIALDLSLKP